MGNAVALDHLSVKDETYCVHEETLPQRISHSCAGCASALTDAFAKPSDKVRFRVANYVEVGE